jgi:hypothetical protein
MVMYVSYQARRVSNHVCVSYQARKVNGLVFFSVRQIFFPLDSFSKLPDRMSDKLSWIFDMSGLHPEIEFSNTFTLIKTGMRFKQVSTDIHRFW